MQWAIHKFLFLVILLSGNTLHARSYTHQLIPEESDLNTSHIKLSGALSLSFPDKNGIPAVEFSGISWDQDEQLLYVISDEGYLYHFRPIIHHNKLIQVELINAFELRSRKNKRLKKRKRDAEGLTTLNSHNGKRGDTELIISFENQPRIERFNTQGKKLKKINIPASLTQKENYRHPNKALESITYHPKYSVITAAEFPLKPNPLTIQSLYTANGKQWHFEASPHKNSAITGLETLHNGDILILERAWNSPIQPTIITLSQLHLQRCNPQNHCPRTILQTFNSADGWRIDNFEGLAHYKDNQYFMVSDNNQNLLQQSLLLLFEILISQ